MGTRKKVMNNTGNVNRSIEFHSFEDLKVLVDRINITLDNFGDIFTGYPNQVNLSKKEVSMLCEIYRSFYRDKKISYGNPGDVFRQIAGGIFNIMQILLPAENISRNFRVLVCLEWMEHIIIPEKKNFRDHILHPANVCWIGEELIFSSTDDATVGRKFPFYEQIKLSLTKILNDECKNYIHNERDWEKFIKLTWYIASLFHDLGYPIEIIEKKITGPNFYFVAKHYFSFRDLVGYIEKHFSTSCDFFISCLRAIDSDLITNPKSYSENIHAILGSLELLHFLDENPSIIRNDRQFFKYVLCLAALAIFEHHSTKQIIFELNPFGYMLALADSIHEWGRYINGGSPEKPSFQSPIKKVIFHANGGNDFLIQYQLSKRLPGKDIWDEEKFKEGKEKELKRFQSDKNPFNFNVELVL